MLTDFGISRILNTQSIAVAGFHSVDLNGASIRYAAPEVLFAFRSSSFDTRPQIVTSADMYAFAVSALELIYNYIRF